jgi:uncharacterized metal-binding protein
MATQDACDCSCGSAPKLIYSCSGAADVGAIADLAARKLSREGAGKMSCLAGIGGDVAGLVKSAEAASAILAIDGCPLNCARKTLEKAGFTGFLHLELSGLGFRKTQSPVDDAAIGSAAAAGGALLAQVRSPAPSP